MIVLCRGEWQTHEKHGRQFAASYIEEQLPVDRDAIAEYLAKAKLPGVGPKTAKRIVDAFGEETFATIECAPERLGEAGVRPKFFVQIHTRWMERVGAHRVMLFLQSHGVPPAMSVKINAHLLREGVPTEYQIAHLGADPYCISYVSGVGFLTADALAQRLGTAKNDPARYAAGAIHVLHQRADNGGHIYCELGELDRLVAELLGVDGGDVEPVVRAYATRPRWPACLIDDGKTFAALSHLHYAEATVARELSRLASRRSGLVGADHPLLRGPFHLGHSGATLNEEQSLAVMRAWTQPLSIVTGGPGTGKTATMRAILEIADKLGLTAACCAPTGLAALRLADSTGHPASTMHAAIGAGWKDGPWVIEADILVLDEVSMVGVMLGSAFFPQVRCKTVVLVGDANQLPSVEPGNLLRDIIDSGVCPVTQLAHVYRQGIGSRGSGIVDACHAVIAGERPTFTERDFKLFAEDDDEVAADRIAAGVARMVRSGVSIADVMVMSPMRKGPVGTDALNAKIQAAVNPARAGKAEMPYRGGMLREGDRVIQLRNDVARRGLVNGDIGYVIEIDPARHRAFIAFNGARGTEMDREALGMTALAYALTVHKMQGSESRHVIAPITTGHYVMLSRNILYTLLSRGRESCTLVGTARAVAMAVRRESNSLRATRLSGLLRLSKE